MKLLHTADWHLGRILYGRSLIEDQRHFIDHFLFPLIDAEKPDGVLLSGDIFDRQIAPVEAIRLFDDFVTRLCLDRPHRHRRQPRRSRPSGPGRKAVPLGRVLPRRAFGARRAPRGSRNAG